MGRPPAVVGSVPLLTLLEHTRKGTSPTTPAKNQMATRCFLGALAVVAAIAVAEMTGLDASGFSLANESWRLLASTCFVAVALVGVLSHGLSRYGNLVLAGLAFCWVGDVVGPLNFMCGVASFLVGHCFFAAGFVARGITRKRVLGPALFYTAAGAAVSVWLLPHVPRQNMPMIVAYMAVISVMAALAWSVKPTRREWIIGVAALVFYVSDIFVARGQYVASDSLNIIMCYPLYYGACMMLAFSISLELPTSPEPAHRLSAVPPASHN